MKTSIHIQPILITTRFPAITQESSNTQGLLWYGRYGVNDMISCVRGFNEIDKGW